MVWNGGQLKKLLADCGQSITALSAALKVSRPTIYGWINGQIPKGGYLVNLCDFFKVAPSVFFEERPVCEISISLHRTNKQAKLTAEMEQAAKKLVDEYALFFKSSPARALVQVLQTDVNDKANAPLLAKELRDLAKIDPDKPMNYEQVFELIKKLGMVAVFRVFPEELKKGRAFYSKIFNHRVIFVNASINVLDLIFYLLHETIHALRDERTSANDEAEESFCDEVAGLIQFPDKYIRGIAEVINATSPAFAVNRLKKLAAENGHCIYGVQKRIEALKWWPKNLNVNSIHGADANVRKHYHTIAEILLRSGEARDFIGWLKQLSPKFVELISSYLPQCSSRKLGELLGFDNVLDAEALKSELQRIDKV